MFKLLKVKEMRSMKKIKALFKSVRFEKQLNITSRNEKYSN